MNLSSWAVAKTAESRKVSEFQMSFTIELEQEVDGRWIAEVIELPGALAYGSTPEEAKSNAQALALRVVVDRRELGESA